jgi:hypothetical protein
LIPKIEGHQLVDPYIPTLQLQAKYGSFLIVTLRKKNGSYRGLFPANRQTGAIPIHDKRTHFLPQQDRVVSGGCCRVASRLSISVIPQILYGDPKLILCEYQDRHPIGMTVMGAFSHTRLHDLLLGSFTVKMLLLNKKFLLMLR